MGDGAERRHQLLRFHEVIPAPLLRADLDDQVRILVVGVEHHVDARDVVRNRLLDVDVLAGGERVGRDPGVREVGRADEHRVDVVAVEHTTIVADDVERLGERAIGALEVGLLVLRDLASHRELHVVVARERVEHATGPAAHADDGHPHAVVGALPGEQGLGGCHCQRSRAVLQELSSMHNLSLNPGTRAGGDVHSTARPAPPGMNLCGVYIRLSVSWGYDEQRLAAYKSSRRPPSCRSPSGMSDRSSTAILSPGAKMRRNWPASIVNGVEVRSATPDYTGSDGGRPLAIVERELDCLLQRHRATAARCRPKRLLPHRRHGDLRYQQGSHRHEEPASPNHNPRLDFDYTVFARVCGGMEVVDEIADGVYPILTTSSAAPHAGAGSFPYHF